LFAEKGERKNKIRGRKVKEIKETEFSGLILEMVFM
jgi:hypothetical protein